MPAKVQILVEAKDATSGVFRAIGQQLGGLGEIIGDLTSANVSWGNVAASAAQMVFNGIKDAMKVTMEYAGEVRDLALASGTSAEEASRLLQVLDDFQISAQDVTAATRAMTKQGLEPSLESIALLADRYVTLNGAQEKNEFILKNLGRAGLQWANALSKGGDALREMGTEVSDALILTDEQIRATEEYRLAVDQLNDQWMAFKVTVGTEVIPALNQVFFGLNNQKVIHEEMIRLMETGEARTRDEALAMAKLNIETQLAAQSADEATGSIESQATAMEAAEAAAKELAERTKAVSDENRAYLGVLDKTGSALADYQKAQDAANLELAEGKITAEEHAAKMAELAAQYQKSSNEIVLSILEMKYATDGWTDTELSAYLNIGTAMGVFTQQQKDAATKAIGLANALEKDTAALANQDIMMTRLNGRTEDAVIGMDSAGKAAEAMGEKFLKDAAGGVGATNVQLASLPKTGTMWSYYFNIYTKGKVPNVPNNYADKLQGDDRDIGLMDPNKKQTGGPVYAGNPYMVGEAGPEPFIPAVNGRILGHAESLHALMLGGGGGAKYGPFYGPVSLNISEEGASGIMGIR